MSTPIDFDFVDAGSLVMVHCMNAPALEHLRAHTDGHALAVEPRYAPDLSADLCRAGFTINLPNGRTVTAADLRDNADE